MTELLQPKIEANGIIDIALMGICKIASEQILAPIIGNASPKSGVIKVAGGALLQGVLPGKIGRILGGGIMIDGVEDLGTVAIYSLMPKPTAQPAGTVPGGRKGYNF